ncbi:hypothetical protein HDU81_011211 [Chytriomyces hyalinus]|nr:hypothetical protein HDU81_011211 [Chytriomyces hyalinus]
MASLKLKTSLANMKTRVRKSFSFSPMSKKAKYEAAEEVPRPLLDSLATGKADDMATVPQAMMAPAAEDDLAPPAAALFSLCSAKNCVYAEQIRIVLAVKGVVVQVGEIATPECLDATVMSFPDGITVKGANKIMSRLNQLFPDPDFYVRVSHEFSQACHSALSTTASLMHGGSSSVLQIASLDETLRTALDVIEDHIGAAQPLFGGGSTLCRADVQLAPVMHRISLISELYGIELARPTLEKYMTALAQVPEVKSQVSCLADVTDTILSQSPELAQTCLARLQKVAAQRHLESAVALAIKFKSDAHEDSWSTSQFSNTAPQMDSGFSGLYALMGGGGGGGNGVVSAPASKDSFTGTDSSRAIELNKRVNLALPILGETRLLNEFHAIFDGVLHGLVSGMKMWPKIWLQSVEFETAIAGLERVLSNMDAAVCTFIPSSSMEGLMEEMSPEAKAQFVHLLKFVGEE